MAETTFRHGDTPPPNRAVTDTGTTNPESIGAVPPAPDQSTAPSAGDAPAGRPDLPGFRFVRLLGRGGMGVVYEAEQVALKRRVAVKYLSGGDLELAARLR